MTTTRDRGANPSINWPESAEEARLAVIKQAQRSLTESTYSGIGRLNRPFTTDAGLGQTRTEEQAEWLEDARIAVLSNLGYALDAMLADIDKDKIYAASPHY
jgi:hypothetical protein